MTDSTSKKTTIYNDDPIHYDTLDIMCPEIASRLDPFPYFNDMEINKNYKNYNFTCLSFNDVRYLPKREVVVEIDPTNPSYKKEYISPDNEINIWNMPIPVMTRQRPSISFIFDKLKQKWNGIWK